MTFQRVYCSASVTNLQKLEKVQLRAARIITANSEVWILEIVLQLTSKIGIITRDTGETVPSAKWYILTLPLVLWNLITYHSALTQRIIYLDEVFFHPELPVHVNKQAELPAYLKQLALERIGDIPIDAVQVYTDGSRDDYY
ncbi:uncharacterized protein TNCV_4484331 [Trichonephila clavipes]|nr:uncharacterized protein TNCV_4484331 [Trichonephila clavipes]